MTSSRGYGSAGAVSVVDAGSSFDGVYRSPGDLRVEGEFQGEIHCEGTVTVSESARVSGVVEASNVTVSGRLEGQVTCSDKFEIRASGQVSAGVLAGAVVIREGAFYEGEMRMHVAPAGLPAREFVAGVDEPASQEPTPLSAAPSARERLDAAAQAAAE